MQVGPVPSRRQNAARRIHLVGDRHAFVEERRRMAHLQNDQRMYPFMVIDSPDRVEASRHWLREAVRIAPGQRAKVPAITVFVVLEPRRRLELQRADEPLVARWIVEQPPLPD